MKNALKVGILTLCSAVLLTACQQEQDGTALAKEKAYDTGSALVKIGGSVPKSELSLADLWQYEGYSVEVYELVTESASGGDDGKFLIAVVETADGDWRFLDMSSRFSAVHQFTKEELSDYREECRELLSRNVSAENSDGENSSNQLSKVEDFPCYLLDGARFECFETVSGEDMILSVFLYYSEDSGIPSAYKGELSNGMEFWFEPYATSADSIFYQIDCGDGTTAYLEHSASEIILTAEQGILYACQGTYMELPDEIED